MPGDVRAFVAELDRKHRPTGARKLGPRRINMTRDQLLTMFADAHVDRASRHRTPWKRKSTKRRPLSLRSVAIFLRGPAIPMVA
jgi:hypothetical protein